MMVAFMMLVFAAVAVYLFSNVKRLRRENSDMQQRVFNLEALVNKLQVQFRSGEAALPPEELQSEALMIADQIAETVVHTPPDMVSVPEAAGKESPNQSAPGKRNIWQILETQFVENWTGILGSIILVMGIGFLGIFAALKFSPLMRFSMMCGAAGMLYGIYRYFNFRQKWLKLASWLRSAAGAIFLFACLGAGGIPGLQWIFDPLSGLVVLAAGIAVNIYLGAAGGKQMFASLHVVLSMVALSIAPQNNLTFIIAVIVSISGIALNYRYLWDKHLLLTASAFFLYHLYWYFSIKTSGPLPPAQNLLGIVTVIAVSVSAAIVHYRESYRTKKFDVLPFIVHLFNWFYFGLGLFVHATGSPWKSILIFTGAIAAFFLARRAKQLQIGWLYHTDTLIAQATALIGIMTLSSWDVDAFTIIGLMFLESLLFMIIMLREQEARLYRIGSFAAQAMALALISGCFLLLDRGDDMMRYRYAAMLFMGLLSTLLFHLYTLRTSKISFNAVDHFPGEIHSRISILAILIGGMIVAIAGCLHIFNYSEYLMLLMLLPVIYLSQRCQSGGLSIAVIWAMAGVHCIGWYHYEFGIFEREYHELFYLLPFSLLSISAIAWSRVQAQDFKVTAAGCYFLFAHLVFMSIWLLNPISTLLPGPVWLLFSAAAVSLAQWLRGKYRENITARGKPDRYFLHAGYFLIVLFLVRHALIHWPSPEYIGIFKARWLIEILAVGIFFWWAIQKQPASGEQYRSWRYLHPLFAELILIFSVISISVEANAFWRPILWMAAAFATLAGGKWFQENISRLQLYSYYFFAATAWHIAFFSGDPAALSAGWYSKTWFAGLIAIVLQFGYVYSYYLHASPGSIALPKLLSFQQPLIHMLRKHHSKWLIYPLIFSVAIFLFWTFDKSILTFLWITQCLAVFVLSIILKESHFRHVALIGSALCILRLFFYDLANAGTLMRAVVFLGVGTVMLLMNWVYGKYKERFLDQQNIS